MSIIAIDGKRFDITKAKRTWELDHHDGRNRHTGTLYLSARGTWYVHTPSQWSNGRRWELIDPAEALERYQEYLSEDERAEIVALADLEVE
jgi:hypothetical protein